MIIYQLHEVEGEYEDFSDIIVGSYVRKQCAEAEKTKRIKEQKEKEKQAKKCSKCKVVNKLWDSMSDVILSACEYADIEASEFKCADIEASEPNIKIFADCHNYFVLLSKPKYYIQDVEVSE